MPKSKKQLHEEIRNRFMKAVKESLEQAGEEVLLTNSNTFAIPCLDENGDDEFLVLTFKVPTGTREGDAYDGYGEAEAYAEKVAEKAEKARVAAIEKAKKIARDKAEREAKAKAKAEHEAALARNGV